MQPQQIITLISVTATMFGIIGFIILMANYYTLNGIKTNTYNREISNRNFNLGMPA